MGCFKFSVILVYFLFISGASWAEQITVENCIQANFSEFVSHKAKPFGLLKNLLRVSKDKCIITVYSERYKYLKKEWKIDVCREPIHIKYGTGAVEVYKRDGICADAKSSFCKSYEQLMQTIEDDGLIFAEGERDNLSSGHGKIYCASLLIKAYLQEGTVFSRFRHYNHFFEQSSSDRAINDAPASTPFVEKVKENQEVLEEEIEKVDEKAQVEKGE